MDLLSNDSVEDIYGGMHTYQFTSVTASSQTNTPHGSPPPQRQSEMEEPLPMLSQIPMATSAVNSRPNEEPNGTAAFFVEAQKSLKEVDVFLRSAGYLNLSHHLLELGVRSLAELADEELVKDDDLVVLGLPLVQSRLLRRRLRQYIATGEIDIPQEVTKAPSPVESESTSRRESTSPRGSFSAKKDAVKRASKNAYAVRNTSPGAKLHRTKLASAKSKKSGKAPSFLERQQRQEEARQKKMADLLAQRENDLARIMGSDREEKKKKKKAKGKAKRAPTPEISAGSPSRVRGKSTNRMYEEAQKKKRKAEAMRRKKQEDQLAASLCAKPVLFTSKRLNKKEKSGPMPSKPTETKKSSRIVREGTSPLLQNHDMIFETSPSSSPPPSSSVSSSPFSATSLSSSTASLPSSPPPSRTSLMPAPSIAAFTTTTRLFEDHQKRLLKKEKRRAELEEEKREREARSIGRDGRSLAKVLADQEERKLRLKAARRASALEKKKQASEAAKIAGGSPKQEEAVAVDKATVATFAVHPPAELNAVDTEPHVLTEAQQLAKDEEALKSARKARQAARLKKYEDKAKLLQKEKEAVRNAAGHDEKFGEEEALLRLELGDM